MVVLNISLQQSVVLFDNHDVQFLLATVRDFRFNVCFLCLEVSCYKQVIMKGMIPFYFYFVPQEEHFCLIFQLPRFGLQPKSFPIHVLQIDLQLY